MQFYILPLVCRKKNVFKIHNFQDMFLKVKLIAIGNAHLKLSFKKLLDDITEKRRMIIIIILLKA